MTFSELMQQCFKIKENAKKLGISDFDLLNTEIYEQSIDGRTLLSEKITLEMATSDEKTYFIIKGNNETKNKIIKNGNNV